MKKREKFNFLMVVPVIVVLILITALLLKGNNASKRSENSPTTPNPVVIEGEKQIVNIIARSGYSPREVSAKAGVPTILKITSDNAYGCERAFTIPSLDIERTLPINGEETFDIGTFKAGDSLFASCSMGMYTFEINFE